MNRQQPIYSNFLACPDCDLLVKRQWATTGYALYCPRCNCLLQKSTAHSIEKSLALSLAGILIFFPALFLPLLTFKFFGFSDSGNLLHSILHLFTSKFYFVASMVALFTAIFPFAILWLVFVVSFSLHFRIYSRWTVFFFRTYLHISEWAMMDVYLLGIMVAIIKMITVAKIDFLPGFFCFIAIAILIVTLISVIDKTFFWEEIEKLQPQSKNKRTKSIHFPTNTREGKSALNLHLLRCHDCGKIIAQQHAGEQCPRCKARLHLRKPNSRERSWAFVCTAAILLFPANLLPVMGVNLLADTKLSTIIDGIIYFFKGGSWFVGTIILVASVFVPFFKVIGLYILLCAKQKKDEVSLQKRTRLYRFITVIGRWSMLDIFVIALLASSVDFGFVSSTWIASGARWFCLVVIITMLATINFDPRLMWDNSQQSVSSP